MDMTFVQASGVSAVAGSAGVQLDWGRALFVTRSDHSMARRYADSFADVMRWASFPV